MVATYGCWCVTLFSVQNQIMNEIREKGSRERRGKRKSCIRSGEQKQQPPTSPSEKERKRKLDYFLGNSIERLSRKWVYERIWKWWRENFLEKQVECREMNAKEKKRCYEQAWGFANILNVSEQSEIYFWLQQITSSWDLLAFCLVLKFVNHLIKRSH